jgi:hypothetical protein
MGDRRRFQKRRRAEQTDAGHPQAWDAELPQHRRLAVFRKTDQPVGPIPRNFHGELQTSCKEYSEGERVKFWMDGNSAKCDSKLIRAEAGVLRAAETTINNVDVFRTYRAKRGGPDDDLQWRKVRKGICRSAPQSTGVTADQRPPDERAVERRRQ